MKSKNNIIVSYHALQRWRERGADHYNETYDDLLNAFEKSKHVKYDELVPFVRTSNKTYYKHESGVYFVLVPTRGKSDREYMITIILPTIDYYIEKISKYEKKRWKTVEEMKSLKQERNEFINTYQTKNNSSIKKENKNYSIIEISQLKNLASELNQKIKTLKKNSKERKIIQEQLSNLQLQLTKLNIKKKETKNHSNPSVIKYRQSLIEKGLIIPQ